MIQEGLNIFNLINDYLIAKKLSNEFLIAWETYFNEAIWGWQLIQEDIQRLPPASRVLEIGAGPQVLTCKVSSQNVTVTAIEPFGQGFSIMRELGNMVSVIAGEQDIKYDFIETNGESFVKPQYFDFAYSINVMEHVDDVNLVLENVIASLRNGGQYHFVCPNYAFPFEPHFNSLTLLNKKLTDRFLKPRILRYSNNPEAEDLWKSLNWITVRGVKKWSKNRDDISIKFSNRALLMYVSRSISDATFQNRHPKLSKFTRVFQKIIEICARAIPNRFLPIIDVVITKF